MTPARVEFAAPWSRVKHSTTEPLRSQTEVWYPNKQYEVVNLELSDREKFNHSLGEILVNLEFLYRIYT